MLTLTVEVDVNVAVNKQQVQKKTHLIYMYSRETNKSSSECQIEKVHQAFNEEIDSPKLKPLYKPISGFFGSGNKILQVLLCRNIVENISDYWKLKETEWKK